MQFAESLIDVQILDIHDIIAPMLDARGIGYRMKDNAFVSGAEVRATRT